MTKLADARRAARAAITEARGRTYEAGEDLEPLKMMEAALELGRPASTNRVKFIEDQQVVAAIRALLSHLPR